MTEFLDQLRVYVSNTYVSLLQVHLRKGLCLASEQPPIASRLREQPQLRKDLARHRHSKAATYHTLIHISI